MTPSEKPPRPHRSCLRAKATRLVLASVPLAFVARALDASDEKPTSGRSLTPEAADALRGGARVDVQYPPQDNWYQSFDDLAFRAQVTDLQFHQMGDPYAKISIWSNDAVGAGKHAWMDLDTTTPNNSVEWRTRVTWPTQGLNGGKPDLEFKYFWPPSNAFYVADGDSQRSDMYLHGNVKVADIKLHTVTSGNSTVEADWNRYSRILDAKTYFALDRMDDLTDGIFGQCGSNANNGNKRHWQVRLNPEVREISVLQACDNNDCVPCTDLKAVKDTFCPGQTGVQSLSSCAPVFQCLDRMITQTNAGDIQNRVSVYHLDTSPVGAGTSFVWPRPGGVFMGITKTHMDSGDEFFARLFTHELGHRILNLPDLAVPGEPLCANTPNDGVNDDDHPLMCSVTPGRFLYPAECSTGYASTVTDWNSQ